MTIGVRSANRVPTAVVVLVWVAVPLICVLMLWRGSTRLATRIYHAPPGMRGNFVVTTHQCEQQLCITGGTFTSDTKKLVVTDLLGQYQWSKLGSTHRVIYDLDAADVIPLPGTWDPSEPVLGIVGALTLLGIWGWSIRTAVRRRDSPPAAAPA